MTRGGHCWNCQGDADCQVTGTETRAPAVLSCLRHVSESATALLGAGASVVLVKPLEPPARRSRERKAYPGVAEVMEQVRRVAAVSRDQEAVEAMEREFHTAVLAAIAQGAPEPGTLAATALLTLNYGHDRRRA